MPSVDGEKVAILPLPSLTEILPIPLPALPHVQQANGVTPSTPNGLEAFLHGQSERASAGDHLVLAADVEHLDASGEDLTGLADPTIAQAITWIHRAKAAQARLFEENHIPPSTPSSERKALAKANHPSIPKAKPVPKPRVVSTVGTSGPGSKLDEAKVEVKAETKKEFELLTWDEPEVWVLEKTGEVFWTYEAYAERIAFYRQKVFQGETSTAQGLTYYDALNAEAEEARNANRAFPEQLKGPILRAVQFHIEGRLDDLMEQVYDRFASRYFVNEKLFVHLDGDKYLANVCNVFPPASLTQSFRKGVKAETASSASTPAPHFYGCNLKISSDKAVGRDDPSEYEYQVQLITQENIDASENFGFDEDGSDKWGPRQFQVPADQLHRDRTTFSKTNLKRYLRDVLYRESLAYSPWLVLPEVAARYGLPTEMSDKVRIAAETYRQSKWEERKRPRTNKEDEDELEETPPAAKRSKKSMSKEERLRIAEEERVKQEEEDRIQEEEERKKKRKPTKFPAEDLLLEHTPHEKRHDKPLQRPVPSRSLPFPGHFEMFLLTWSFLNSMSEPLGLSQFTSDQFENALYQSEPSTNALLTEVHAVLLNTIRRDHTELEQPRVYPLKAFEPVLESDESGTRESSPLESEYSIEGTKMKVVSQACLDHMDTWEQRELSPGSARKDWQKSLVGCLWARGMVTTLPNLLSYVRHMLLDEEKTRPGNGPGWVAEPSHPKLSKRVDLRYATMNHVFKLEIISFLCELVMQTKLCRDVFEESTMAVTRCRVDQNDVRRELRRLYMELEALDPKATVEADGEINGNGGQQRSSASPSVNGTGTDRDDAERVAHSDESESEGDSGAENKRGKASAMRQKLLISQQAQRDAEQARRKMELQQAAEQAKAKRLEGKALALEKLRLNEEITNHDQQLAELEREFRRQYHFLRVSPLGQDRFGNKIWWFDGCGSADVVEVGGGIIYGTGRLYIQGGSPGELARRAEQADLSPEEVEEKRVIEESAEGLVEEGDWAYFDTPEEFSTFCKWLNAKGIRETKLLDVLRKWEYAIEGGMRKRREVFDIEPAANGDADGSAKRVRRPAGSRSEPQYRGREAFLNYKNILAGK